MVNYYIIPIFVPHRGCPHDCVFCNQKRITGKDENITGEYVAKTIDTYLETIDKQNSYVEVSFFGGSFTGIPIDQQNELLVVAKHAKESGRIKAIRLSTRPDYIDDIILSNLKAHGVDVIELGVQSMDQEVLEASERGHSREDVIKASNLIRKYGFKLGLQMMIGLPKDTRERDLYTAREIIGLHPDFVRIYPALVIKGTYMEHMYYAGMYNSLSVDEAVDISKALYIEFTKSDIQIIRIGLQPTEQINMENDVAAGPFHPAFRELVESSIINEQISFMIDTYFNDSSYIEISINPRDISKLYADKKRYYNNITGLYKTKKIKVQQSISIDNTKISISDGKKERNMSLYEYIKLVK